MAESDHRHELELVLSPDYVTELEGLGTAELRQRRQRAEKVENRVSYARRLLQGRIDLVRAEVLRRGDDEGLAQVLEGLPAVLADHGGAPLSPAQVRPPRDLSPPDLEDDPLQEQVLDLPNASAAELQDLADSLAARERELSQIRRQLFDVIDQLQSELMSRYRSGAASIDELLAEQ